MTRRLRSIGLLLMCAVLNGCGGGGNTIADTGIGGSGGAARGPIQGFGSIIVNDFTLDIDQAGFEIEGKPAGTGTTGQSQLREGQVIVAYANLESGVADSVYYRSDVRGPLVGAPVIIDPLTGAGRLNVLGQTVLTDSTTVYANGAALDTLVDGDQVEISGSRDAGGNLVASFVELETGLTEYKVVGTVTNARAENKTFNVDGLLVDYSAATLSDLSGDPANGTRVEVRLAASGFTPPASAAATAVEGLQSTDFEEGTELSFEGLIDRFASNTDFDVSGQPVTTTASTTFENGSAASLGLNVKVEAEGAINSAGVLVATAVTIKPTGAVRAESTVSAVDTVARTISVDVGLTFVVRNRTEIEDERENKPEGDLTLDGLQTGDYVRIRGYLDGSTLVAAEVEVDDFNSRFALRAPVVTDDPASGALSLLGVQVRGSEPTTEFEDANGNAISQSAFFDLVGSGTFVEARWDPFVSTDEIAGRLSIED